MNNEEVYYLVFFRGGFLKRICSLHNTINYTIKRMQDLQISLQTDYKPLNEVK